MEIASKDVLFTIAMNLALPSLLNWCESSSHVNRNVCLNQTIWRSKLLKDFPDGYPDYQKFGLDRSLKETYVFLYQLSYIKKLLKTNESLYDIFLKKELNLSRKILKKVPAFDLPNLEELYLYNNKLTEVPAFNLPKLEVLFLSNNQLTKVPVFNLPNLRRLYLSNNQLTEVPNLNLPNLQELYFSKNRLTETTKKEMKRLYGNKLMDM